MRGEVRAAPAKRVGVLDMNGLKVSRGGTSESGSYVKVSQWGRAPRRPWGCLRPEAPAFELIGAGRGATFVAEQL